MSAGEDARAWGERLYPFLWQHAPTEEDLAPDGELAQLLAAAPAQALVAGSESVQRLQALCFPYLLPQMWRALAANQGLGTHWWAGQGLDLVTRCNDGRVGLEALVTGLGSRLTSQPDLLEALLRRLGTEGAFADLGLVGYFGPMSPALGWPDRDWSVVAAASWYGPDSRWLISGGWHTTAVSDLGGQDLVLARATWEAGMSTYRHGLGTFGFQIAGRDLPLDEALIRDARAVAWPEITSAQLLGANDLSTLATWVRHQVASGIVGARSWDEEIVRLVRWATKAAPVGSTVADVVALAVDAYSPVVGPLGSRATRGTVARNVRSVSR